MWLCCTILGGPEVPEVKYIKAGSVIDMFLFPNTASWGIFDNSEEKSITLAVEAARGSTCTICSISEQFSCTFKNFCILVESPIKAEALVCRHRNSMSFSTRRVVAGQITMPLRIAATAISHPQRSQYRWKGSMWELESYHSGSLGRIIIIRCPAVRPRLSKSTAIRWDCLWKCL